jgi:hypothetical protein
MATTITKGQIGEQDLKKYDGSGTDTFSRITSAGDTVTLNKVGYEVDVFSIYGAGVSYTDATITSALTAIGTSTECTIVLKPGTWTIDENIDWSSYTNVTFKFPRGAILTHSTYSVTLPPNIDAGEYQIFSGAGTISLSGSVKAVYPEWFGLSTSASGTDNITYLNSAISAVAAGGKIKFASGTSYPCDGQWTLSKAVTVDGYGTELTWDSADDAATDQGILVTASNVQILGLKVTGVQDDAYVATQVGIFAYGTYNSGSAPTYITGLKIKDCNITNWSSRGIRMRFVQYFDVSGNYLDSLFYAGIVGESVNYGTIDNNKVNNVLGYVLSGLSKQAYGIYCGMWGTYTNTESPRSSYVIVSNNHVYKVPYWEGLDTHGGANISFINNTVRDTYRGLMICGSVDSATAYEGTDNVIAIGNTITTTETFAHPLYSVGIENSPGVASYAAGEYNENTKIIGNTTNGYYWGIYDSYTKGSKIQGNTILGIPDSAANTYKSAGINIYGVNIDIDVTGNTFSNMDAGSLANIYFQASVTADESYGVVTGNILNTTDADYGIYVASESARNVRIINNKFTGTPDTANYRYQTRAGWDSYIDQTEHKKAGTLDTLALVSTYLPTVCTIVVKASGYTDATSGTKLIKFSYGGTAIDVIKDLADSNFWTFEATIMQSAENAQKVSWVATYGDASDIANTKVLNGYQTMSASTSAGGTNIGFTASTTGGGYIYLEMLSLERKYE